MARIINIVPMGSVPSDLLPWLIRALWESARCRAKVGGSVSVPASSYDPQREQYLGDDLLYTLRSVPLRPGERALGLADMDCYAQDLNFIFGQASPGLGIAFVALPRLRQSFYGLPEDEPLFRARVLKESIHELGHTWGLPHCQDPECVMQFSNNLRDADAKEATFCRSCAGRLPTGGPAS